MEKRLTKEVHIGNRVIGGANPVLIQSMTNTKTEDAASTVAQIQKLTKAGCDDRRALTYHKMLLEGKLPCTIGGGIGQSRHCAEYCRHFVLCSAADLQAEIRRLRWTIRSERSGRNWGCPRRSWQSGAGCPARRSTPLRTTSMTPPLPWPFTWPGSWRPLWMRCFLPSNP